MFLGCFLFVAKNQIRTIKGFFFILNNVLFKISEICRLINKKGWSIFYNRMLAFFSRVSKKINLEEITVRSFLGEILLKYHIPSYN